MDLQAVRPEWGRLHIQGGNGGRGSVGKESFVPSMYFPFCKCCLLCTSVLRTLQVFDLLGRSDNEDQQAMETLVVDQRVTTVFQVRLAD